MAWFSFARDTNTPASSVLQSACHDDGDHCVFGVPSIDKCSLVSCDLKAKQASLSAPRFSACIAVCKLELFAYIDIPTNDRDTR